MSQVEGWWGQCSGEGESGLHLQSGTCLLSVSVYLSRFPPNLSLANEEKNVKILTRQVQESPEEDKIHINVKSLFKG